MYLLFKNWWVFQPAMLVYHGGTFNNKKEVLWPWAPRFFFEKKTGQLAAIQKFFFDGNSWCEKISNDSSCFHVNICFTVRSPGGRKLLFQHRFRRCKTNHEVFVSAQCLSSSHVHQQPSKDALIDQVSNYLVFTHRLFYSTAPPFMELSVKVWVLIILPKSSKFRYHGGSFW